MSRGAGGGDGAGARAELGDAPPFWTWRRIYWLVAGVLVLQVIVYAAITAAYK